MPIDCLVSPDLDLKLSRWSGEVAIDEYRAVFDAYLDDTHYRLGRPELCDMSKVTKLDADFSRIWSILSMVNGQAGGAVVTTPCVIFAPRDAIFGLGRMYQSLAENAGGVQVQVYREEAEVMAALMLPGDSIADLERHARFYPPTPCVVRQAARAR